VDDAAGWLDALPADQVDGRIAEWAVPVSQWSVMPVIILSLLKLSSDSDWQSLQL
jgi:hypothetical protein